MSLVPAKCTQCGANLIVDNTKDAAVCEHCGTAFIIEKAINNFTLTGNQSIIINSAVINVKSTAPSQDSAQNTPSAENLLLRAEEFEQSGDFSRALEYYNKVLDLNPSDSTAKDAVDRINNRVIAEITLTPFGSSKSTLTLTRSELIHVTKKGRFVYPTKAITSVTRNYALLLVTLSSQTKALEFPVGKPVPAKVMETALIKVINER